MINILKRSFFICLLTAFAHFGSFAWGSIGHSIVAEIAFHYLDDSTKHIIENYLDGMTVEEAANWMDQMRYDHGYDYMQPWHYINIEKGKSYLPGKGENIVTELQQVLNELSNKNAIPREQMRTNLLILFHLIGDLSQPLHVGYGIDKGGNAIRLAFLGRISNLHEVWDEGIIDKENISTDLCLKTYAHLYTKKKIRSVQSIDIIAWMNQSRSLLTDVYDFNDACIDNDYCKKNVSVIEKQLFLAGVRLAGILKSDFRQYQ